ncbi:hypothetical protein V6N13_048277 [Hibiscus sabdariffa]
MRNDISIVINKMLRREWEVSLNHISCDLNGVVDRLACMMRGQPVEEVLMVEASMQVRELLLRDVQNSMRMSAMHN